MKIFEYNVANGTRGKQLGERLRPNAIEGSLVTAHDGRTLRLDMRRERFGDNVWSWHAGVADPEFSAEDFGVEAICFCLGEWHTGVRADGTRDLTWEWVVISSLDVARKLVKNGVLKTTVIREAKKIAEKQL
jgi:hypothetical protein